MCEECEEECEEECVRSVRGSGVRSVRGVCEECEGSGV